MTTLTIALYIKANMVVSVCLWWQTGQGRAARATAAGGRARCHFY
jgi:hypothetical protein